MKEKLRKHCGVNTTFIKYVKCKLHFPEHVNVYTQNSFNSNRSRTEINLGTAFDSRHMRREENVNITITISFG